MVTKYAVSESTTALSGFGSPYFYFFVIILIWSIDQYFALLLLGQMIILEMMGALIKMVFFKERPQPIKFTNFLEKYNAASFPSMHIARSVALLFPLVSALASIPLLVVSIFIACAVGLSRIRLERHYMIDVVAGAVLGGLVTVVYFSLVI